MGEGREEEGGTEGSGIPHCSLSQVTPQGSLSRRGRWGARVGEGAEGFVMAVPSKWYHIPVPLNWPPCGLMTSDGSLSTPRCQCLGS